MKLKVQPTVILAILMCIVSVWIMFDQFGENMKDAFTSTRVVNMDVIQQKNEAGNFLFMKKLSEAKTEEEERELLRIFSRCDRKCDGKPDAEIPACIMEVAECLEKNL